MIKLYLDVLDQPRRELWVKLSSLAKYKAVLAGGTAIALQIRHRRSVDFDLFLPAKIPASARRNAYQIMGALSHPVADDEHQLTLVSVAGLRLTLVSHPYPPLHKLVGTECLPLFALADLASNKAYTIGRRGTWRDYVDIYFLLHREVASLAEVIQEAVVRFGNEFNPRLFLQQLTYTHDLGDFEIDFLGEEVTSQQMADFFEQQARKYVEKKLG